MARGRGRWRGSAPTDAAARRSPCSTPRGVRRRRGVRPAARPGPARPSAPLAARSPARAGVAPPDAEPTPGSEGPRGARVRGGGVRKREPRPPAVPLGQPPQRVETGRPENKPLRERSDVPVQALLPVEDEARAPVEGRVGDVALMTQVGKVEGERASAAADVERPQKMGPKVGREDRPGVLPGPRPVIVAGPALHGPAPAEERAEPAGLL